MKKLFGILVLALATSAVAAPIPAKPAPKAKVAVDVFPVSEIKIGMRGVAYTVFEGVKPEPMDVEVLGVMRNAQGPKSNIILVRLHGKKVEFTGVVAGMSGSPVYFDGKLAGAIAYRIGEFSKEPIAGVTPIEEMLEIDELDRTQPAFEVKGGSTARAEMERTSGPGTTAAARQASPYANYFKPIETPLVFNGFTEEAVRQFLPEFAAAGMTPVLGAGSVSGDPQPEPIVPGSAVSAVLVRGDLNIASTCTVTYVDPERLLACGHPLMNFGSVEMPMNKAHVLATLPSPANAFKIVNTTERVGAWVQDRHTGILGRFGREPKMVPVTLTVRGAGIESKTYHYEVLNNSRLTPVAMMSTVFSAVRGTNVYGEDATYTLNGNISVKGFPDVKLRNMFAPADTNSPTAQAVAVDVGNRFGQIYQNPWAMPEIGGVHLDLEVTRERRWARLESARTDVIEARPGDEIVVEAVLRPYRGERIVRQLPVKIPTGAPKGTLRILVSDGDTLDRLRRIPPTYGRKLDLASTIALLNREHANNALYVSLLDSNPQAMVEDKVMPTLPVSVMNVMEPMRGTQDMVVVGESAVSETSTPLDYVVSGAQVITVTVK